MNRENLKLIKQDMKDLYSSSKYVQAELREARKELKKEYDAEMKENKKICYPEHLWIWNKETDEKFKGIWIKTYDEIVTSYHNHQCYYFIYADGTEAIVQAEDLLTGDKMPKLSGIVYAEMESADDWIDTEVGDLDSYLEDEDGCRDFELQERYDISVQCKFNTAWSIRYRKNYPDFEPMQI